MTTLCQRVFLIVAKIPAGRVLTYAALARRVRCRSIRAVATCLKSAKGIPCHRVIRSDSQVGAYFGSWQGEKEKARRLKREGVAIIERTGRFFVSTPSKRGSQD